MRQYNIRQCNEQLHFALLSIIKSLGRDMAVWMAYPGAQAFLGDK